MIIILLFFVAHWYLALFMQTFLQHRYAAHAAFSMSKFWERFFYIAAYITQGSSYVSPRAYAVMHRMHHAYTDTDKDPHSPKFDSNIWKLMWHARQVSNQIYKGTFEVEPRFLKNLPDWPAMDKIAHSAWSRIGWVIVYILFYMQFATSPWLYLLLPLQVAMLPLHGAIINWFAHKYGSVNFPMKNTSTNLFKVDLLMMGEAYHNNHHKNPSATNFGFRWFEVDPTYGVIRIFHWMKIIRIHKIAPRPVAIVELAIKDQHQPV
jgi:stearoyl-CoA desaturase (Delta-9 desaturase)